MAVEMHPQQAFKLAREHFDLDPKGAKQPDATAPATTQLAYIASCATELPNLGAVTQLLARIPHIVGRTQVAAAVRAALTHHGVIQSGSMWSMPSEQRAFVELLAASAKIATAT